jgi:hypothetical protein
LFGYPQVPTFPFAGHSANKTVGCNDLKTDWGDGFVVPGFEVKRAAKSLLAAPGNLWVVLVEHGNKWMYLLRSKERACSSASGSLEGAD